MLYCLLKANIPDLYSEVAFLKEFADASIYREEAQYRLTELEQAMTYVQTLDWNVFDEEGVLVSISFLEKRVAEALKSGRSLFYSRVREFPRMLWLAEILLIVGTLRDDGEQKDKPFQLESEYNKYLLEEAYMKLAKGVFSPIGINIVRYDEADQTYFQVEFTHRYPQHVYAKLANLLEQEIQQLNYT